MLAQVQRRTARQTQHGFTPRRLKHLQRTFGQAPWLILEYRAVMLEQRRVRRAHAQGPLAGKGRQGFTRQVEAADRNLDHSRAETAQGFDRDLQGAALAGAQGDVLRGIARQAQQALGIELHFQCLRLVSEVGQVQRQPGLVATGQKARCCQLGDQGGGDNCFGFGHAITVIGPGLRHQTQLTVKVGNIDADFAFTLLIQGHGRALQRHDGHAGGWPLAAFGQCRITAKRQAGQTALPGFDQLPVNIQLIGAVGLAPEQAGVGVRGWVVGDIQHPDVHRSQQYMGPLWNAAIGVFGVDLHRQRLLGAHFCRRIKGQRQLARSAVERQMQHAHGPFGSDIGLALAGADHQCTHIQIVAGPGRIKLDVEGFAVGRHLDFFPPQRAITAFDQQIPFAGCRRRDRHFGGLTIGIRGLVQRQLDLIGAHGTAFRIVLGTITGPKAQAADQPGLRVFDFNPIRAPLHREADLGSFSGLEADRFFVEVQKLLVEVIAPAVIVRVIPVVIAALAHQPDLEVFSRQLVPFAVSHQQFELNRAIAIGLRAIKQTAQPRQALSGPHGLDQTPGNRAPARLLQTGLNNQLQRRFGIAPLAFQADGFLAFGVEDAFVQLQVLSQLGLRY